MTRMHPGRIIIEVPVHLPFPEEAESVMPKLQAARGLIGMERFVVHYFSGVKIQYHGSEGRIFNENTMTLNEPVTLSYEVSKAHMQIIEISVDSFSDETRIRCRDYIDSDVTYILARRPSSHPLWIIEVDRAAPF